MSEKYALGIDLGGSHVAVAAVSESGKIMHNASTDIEDHAPASVVKAIVHTTRRVLDKANGAAVGIGLGSPGNVDPLTGTVRYSPNFGWHDVPLGKLLSDELELPVFLANDARCAALGEYTFGTGRGTKDFVLLTLGTGIGGGIIVDGGLVLGQAMGAGEVGHHQIRPQDGFICGCGKIGCFEAQASGMGLLRQAFAVAPSFPKSTLLTGNPEDLGSKAIRKAAEAGVPHGVAAWNRWLDDLALGVANVIAMLNPQRIALGGGVSSGGEFLRTGLAPRVEKLTTMVPRGSSEIVVAELGNDAGPIGSAVLAFRGGLGKVAI